MLKKILNWIKHYLFAIIAAFFWIDSIYELILMIRYPSFGRFRILFYSIIISVAFTIIADVIDAFYTFRDQQNKDNISLTRRLLKAEEQIAELENKQNLNKKDK